MDLTTTKATFIEEAVKKDQLFITQPYHLYSDENQLAWQSLWQKLLPKWKIFANTKFLEGVRLLNLRGDRIPTLEEVNHFLKPLTRFQAKAVSGYVPSHLFFDCLKRREFPTTITIRDSSTLDYLPEPDIFHDIAGHVPMHTDRAFADTLEKFGYLAAQAAKRSSSILNTRKRQRILTSNLRALSRFFWFTVEFGLICEKDEMRVYGSGLLSSAEEIEHSVTATNVERLPFDLERVINQSFTFNKMQDVLFVINSFEQLFNEVNTLEQWLLSGKLDAVSRGAPDISEEELKQFMETCHER